MGQNNIENQIKEKLNAREIQPSLQSWDRLDAMLTVAEQKKTKRFPFWFIGIAASVLVLLTAGLFLFNQEKTIISNDTTIVEIENKKLETTENPAVEIQNSNQVATAEINNQKSEINNQGVSTINQKNQKINQNPNINRQKDIEFMINEGIGIKDLPKIETGTKLVYSKQEVISNEIKSNYIDTDALLASAENELKTKPKSNKIKVDANSLLTHADGEVEYTFREKVINSVSKSFQEIKVALSTRNQE
jgi:hypothetical protein